MAETEIRIEHWADGVLVDTQTITKPVEQYHEETLTERAAAALTNNADFLALASPTNAQAVTQVKALTRQVNALLRLELRALDDITDTE